jgi:hypothetical protein
MSKLSDTDVITRIESGFALLVYLSDKLASQGGLP